MFWLIKAKYDIRLVSQFAAHHKGIRQARGRKTPSLAGYRYKAPK
jgi:hypothetical protein